MLRSNCRAQFTADDFQFVVQTLSKNRNDAVSLSDLLSDEETRDAVLDHDLLYAELVDNCGCLRVSPALYFYILTRRVLRQAGMEERSLSDYVAGVLVAFSHRRQLQFSPSGSGDRFCFPYVSDLLEQLSTASSQRAFLIRTHVANYTLFLSGVFAERVRAHSERRGGPDLMFYERMGRMNYQMAAQHRMAQAASLDKTYLDLSSRFREIRCALNGLTDNFLHLSIPLQSEPEGFSPA